jgi:4-amino-4-deoxy-L-arabinose transferase-like glycosyltransferase
VSSRAAVTTLLLLWSIVFLGHAWEPGLKMDAMTYAALAKHVLATGDWRTLHYTPSAYADFYQHPPLGIWMQALVFKFFGASDFTARLLPAACGLGTLLAIYRLGLGFASPFLGFLAGLILLTSGRYVKFATDFFLDGPLAFWMAAGTLAFVSATRRGPGLSAVFFGLCVAAGFLTKGLVVLALPLAALLLVPFARRPGRDLLSWSLGMAVALGVLGAWILAGGGAHYLREYWARSVAGRIGEAGWDSHLGPLRALARTYWPWLPILAWGALRAGRFFAEARRENGALALAALQALVILAAFSFTGNYLDHYLVPFYPLAALVAAYPLSTGLARAQHRIHAIVRAAAVLAAVALATLPIRLHLPRGEPLRGVVSEAASRCRGQREILVTGKAAERWLALAVTLWVTPNEATSVDAAPAQASADQLLITAADENAGPGWKKFRASSGLTIHEPAQAALCRAD